MKLDVLIPGELKTWKRANLVKGRLLTSKKERANRNALRWHVLAHRDRTWPLDARYAVKLDIYRNRRRFDLDNAAKQIGDALEGILWANDAQIDRWEIERHYDKYNPRAYLVVDVLESVST